jgi:glycosyltransferase involved in cell wall biosynthesis
MTISVCIPTIRSSTVAATIESMLRQSCAGWELIIVAQGGDARLLDVLDTYRRRDGRIRIVHVEWPNASNARNVGLASATGDIIAFTDDDCEAASDWIEILGREFSAHPDVGYIGGAVVAPPSPRRWWPSTCPAAHVIDAVYHPEDGGFRAPHGFYMIGANVAMRREVWTQVGLFDTTLGPGTPFPACEEQDYNLRVEAAGIPMLTTRRLVVNHTWGRRYGTRAVLAHHRNYARGRGAWIAKLRMWGHRLADEWTLPPRRVDQIRAMLVRPDKWALGRYDTRHVRAAEAEYWRMYELGDDLLSRPRQSSGVPDTSTTTRSGRQPSDPRRGPRGPSRSASGSSRDWS